MDSPQIDRRHSITLQQEVFEAMLTRAAERGAQEALHRVGLDGSDAAHDIRELRGLLDAFKDAKRAAGLTLIKMLVTGLAIALITGLALKLKLFGGE